MGNVVNILKAKFFVGQLIQHRLFDYRGVVVDVDQKFQGSEEWYQTVARSRPPKNSPWYHVLVHGGNHSTYVAERNLAADDLLEPINHPLIDEFFSSFKDGKYLRIDANN